MGNLSLESICAESSVQSACRFVLASTTQSFSKHVTSLTHKTIVPIRARPNRSPESPCGGGGFAQPSANFIGLNGLSHGHRQLELRGRCKPMRNYYGSTCLPWSDLPILHHDLFFNGHYYLQRGLSQKATCYSADLRPELKQKRLF